MIGLLRDLVRHKVHANAALLKAIRRNETAAQDLELRTLLQHILVANRFWFFLSIGIPFSKDEEPGAPESLESIAERYRETHDREFEWISQITEAELDRVLETPFLPGRQFSVTQASMQVCMHSHGHRAQCATRLRALGGEPPAMDFVHWLGERPAPDWS